MNRPFAYECVQFVHPALAKSKRRKAGVYLIDNVYVGASTSVRQRVLGHVNNALSNNHDNKPLGIYLTKKIQSGEPITIHLLSEQITDEQALIDKARQLGLPLLNSTSVYAKAYRPKP